MQIAVKVTFKRSTDKVGECTIHLSESTRAEDAALKAASKVLDNTPTVSSFWIEGGEVGGDFLIMEAHILEVYIE